jgi:uncharacterized protein YjbI with pentapeptide repeats
MKKVLFFALLLMILGAAGVKAQVRIGGNGAPNGAAIIDLNATDAVTGTKGLALPRVNFSSNTAQLVSGVTNLNGMLVYNTNTALGAGMYYWNGSLWVKVSDGSFVEVDGIVGNEITDTIANGGLTRSGSGTAASPYKVGIKTGGVTSGMILDGTIATADIAANAIDSTKIKDKGVGYGDLTTAGATSGQVLKYNGTAWMPAADANTNNTYKGSASVRLVSDSLVRAALTGDVTAAQNNNATTIAANAVTSAKIADGTIVTADLADNSVTSAKIVDATIVAADIANTTITGAKLANATVTATQLADGAVTSAKIADGTIVTADLADNSVTSAKIVDATIVAADIANTTITGAKLANTTITATQLADGAVTSAKILDGTIATADIAANAIDSTKIKDKGVGYGDLTTAGATSGQVLKYNGTAWMPAADANTNNTYKGSASVRLVSDSLVRAALTGDVTAAQNNNATTIANNAVTSAKIADGTIVTADLADNSVTSAKIVDGTIVAGDIANGTITAAKMAAGAVNDADYIVGNEISNVKANGGLRRYGSGTAADPYTVGVDTASAYKGALLRYDGSRWIAGQKVIAELQWDTTFVVSPTWTKGTMKTLSHGIAGVLMSASNVQETPNLSCYVTTNLIHCWPTEDVLNGRRVWLGVWGRRTN